MYHNCISYTMRIKLLFESSPSNSNQQKIFFFVDKTHCKKVVDLSYTLQKRFFNKNGAVSLFSDDGFYFPQQECIDVIKENDILSVKFLPKDNIGKGENTSSVKKRKLIHIQSSSSSSSSNNEYSSLKKVTNGKMSIKKILEKTSSASKSKIVNGKKQIVPLSKLGISNKKQKIEISSSSSSEDDSSDDSSSSSSESDSPEKATKKKETIFIKPMNVKEQVDSLENKVKAKLKNEQRKPGGSHKNESQKLNKSKIDFHVSNLSNNATSTPGNSSQEKLNTSPQTLNMFEKKNKQNFAKQLVSKDVYKNISQVMTRNPSHIIFPENLSNIPTFTVTASENDKDQAIPNEEKPAIINDTKEGEILTNSWVNSSNNSTNQERGKTKRNRRRRQKKVELRRANNMNNTDNAMDENENKQRCSALQAATELNKVTKNDNELGEYESMDYCTTQVDEVHPKEECQVNGHSLKELKDYSLFTELKGLPSISSIIAYKVLEIDSTYQPNLSDYKEARIISHDGDTVQLELCEGFQETKGQFSGKFEMDYGEEIEENSNLISMEWNELQEPRLISPPILPILSNGDICTNGEIV